jgi:hypothetical protein
MPGLGVQGSVSTVAVSNQPSSDSLLALGDSMAFAPWLPWTLDVSDKVKQNELYTDAGIEWLVADAATNQTHTEGSVSGATAALRQWALGSMACQAETTEDAAFTAGVLWMEVQIELVEFCPITSFQGSTAIGPGPLGHRLVPRLSDLAPKWSRKSCLTSGDQTVQEKFARTKSRALDGRLHRLLKKYAREFEEDSELGSEISGIPELLAELEDEAHQEPDPGSTLPEKVERVEPDPNRSCLQMAEGSDLESSVREWRRIVAEKQRAMDIELIRLRNLYLPAPSDLNQKED